MDVHELRAKGGMRLRVRDISSEVPRQLTRSLIHKEIRPPGPAVHHRWYAHRLNEEFHRPDAPDR